MEDCWLELCFGLANNTKDEVVTVPCVLVEEESKIVLRGLASDGTLIPSTGKELLRHLNLQSWVQGRPLKPLKDKPTYWQRSLITAVSTVSQPLPFTCNYGTFSQRYSMNVFVLTQ